MVKRPMRKLGNWGGIWNQSLAREVEKDGYILNISEALDYVASILAEFYETLYSLCLPQCQAVVQQTFAGMGK